MGYDHVNKGYTIKATLGGFLSGGVWGAISIATWFELRKLFVTLMSLLDPNAWAYQWRDYVTLITLGLLWLLGVLWVWNLSEHNFVKKRPIIHTLKYSLLSLGVYGIALAINLFILKV